MHAKTFGVINEWLEKFRISTFTIFITIALIILVNYFIFALEKKEGYTKKQTNKFLVLFGIALAVTYVFALFFDALFHYFENGIFAGGITYIAGLLGGVAAFVLLIKFYYKEEEKNILKVLNLLIPGVIIAHAIGRIGCFSVGCCYGLPTNSIFGVYFPEGTNPYIDGIRVPIHPTQLYEAFFLVGLYFVLKIKVFKNREFASYMIFYGVFRFIMEIFFRGDSRGVIFGIAPSVILSVLMIIIGVLVLLMPFKKNEENKAVSV